MSTATTLMEFFGQKVASLMRQFRKSNKLPRGFILSFQILSTLSAILVRPAFYAQSTAAGVSFAFLIGVTAKTALPDLGFQQAA